MLTGGIRWDPKNLFELADVGARTASRIRRSLAYVNCFRLPKIRTERAHLQQPDLGTVPRYARLCPSGVSSDRRAGRPKRLYTARVHGFYRSCRPNRQLGRYSVFMDSHLLLVRAVAALARRQLALEALLEGKGISKENIAEAAGQVPIPQITTPNPFNYCQKEMEEILRALGQ